METTVPTDDLHLEVTECLVCDKHDELHVEEDVHKILPWVLVPLALVSAGLFMLYCWKKVRVTGGQDQVLADNVVDSFRPILPPTQPRICNVKVHEVNENAVNKSKLQNRELAS
ncbi:uncharacterized protein LOC120331051 [Styela clava]